MTTGDLHRDRGPILSMGNSYDWCKSQRRRALKLTEFSEENQQQPGNKVCRWERERLSPNVIVTLSIYSIIFNLVLSHIKCCAENLNSRYFSKCRAWG